MNLCMPTIFAACLDSKALSYNCTSCQLKRPEYCLNRTPEADMWAPLHLGHYENAANEKELGL